ncbi:MAG: carbon-nitrogen hydrolase family protein [Myxococcota bacterium]
MRAAVVQLTTTSDVARSLDFAEHWIRQAARAGADFVATPEATPFLGPPAQKAAMAEPLDGPIAARMAHLAHELGITLLLGSLPEAREGSRTANTSVLFGPDGATLGVYRKVHLFDVDLPDEGVHLHESTSTEAGTTLTVVDSPVGRIGMTICYDLRFPEVYRHCRDAGAEILTVPSAFTVPTGRAHWEVLLRARAIETQSFVVAPAQVGRHDPAGARESYVTRS